jgi:hypothetical protein
VRREGWAGGWGGCGARGDGGGWVCGSGGWGVGRDRCTVASTSAWLAGMVCVRVHGGGDAGAGQSGKRGVTEGSGWRGGGRGGRGEGGGIEGGVGGVGGVGGGKVLEVRVSLRGLRPGMVYRVWVVGVSKEGVRGAKSEAIFVETRGRVLQSRPLRVALAALCASCVLQPNLSCAQAALGRGLHIPYACGRALGQFLHFSYALDPPPPIPLGGTRLGGRWLRACLRGRRDSPKCGTEPMYHRHHKRGKKKLLASGLRVGEGGGGWAREGGGGAEICVGGPRCHGAQSRGKLGARSWCCVAKWR